MHLVIKPDQYEVNNIMISDKTKNNIIEEMYIKFILGQRMNKIFLSRYINLLAKTTQKDINPHQIKTNVLGN